MTRFGAFGQRFVPLVVGASSLLRALALAIAPPILRVALALPFLRSGLTRFDGFLTLSPATLYLFEEEFRLHLPGGPYALPMPVVLAHATALAEVALPLLLLMGLATRWAALALLLMTGVIQLIVPDGWANFHLYWAALALAIMALGPGPLSADAIGGSVLMPAAERSKGRLS